MVVLILFGFLDRLCAMAKPLQVILTGLKVGVILLTNVNVCYLQFLQKFLQGDPWPLKLITMPLGKEERVSRGSRSC